jgi:hypothetical protein
MICVRFKWRPPFHPKVMADWLDGLSKTKRGKDPFKISTMGQKIFFTRFEDAVAFKLRFGVV